MLDLLAELRLSALTNLSLGCELTFGGAESCLGALAVQKSREEFACHIDLRECTERARGLPSLSPPYREARLAFTILHLAEGGPKRAAPLMRSPVLRYLPKPRLRSAPK